MIDNQIRQKIIKIVERVYENTSKIHYGSVSATLRIHDGRIIDVTHSTTENSREQEEKNETR
jgi:hypothetical protein